MGLLLDGSSWITSTTTYTRTSTDHTVMYWLRLDDNTAVRRPFGHTGNWEARTGAGNNILTSDYLQSGTGNTATMTLGVWQHITFVQDVTGTTRRSYINGVMDNEVTGATFATDQVANLSLGVTAGGSGEGWYGGIDDIRVYDRVMSVEEIQTIHACRGTDGVKDGLSLWYQLNEGVEGAVVSQTLYNIGMDGNSAPNLVTVTGSPTFDYSCGIKYRRYV